MAAFSLKSNEGRWVMTAAILASSMAFIDSTALNTVLPSLQRSLKATSVDLFWVLNAYLLMLASLTLIGGSLADKKGLKKIFIYGISIFISGSVLCGFAPGVHFLIFSRVVQGLGGALMIPGSLSLITSMIAEKERGKAIGIWSAVSTAVTAGGPILSGALGDAGLWRWVFFLNVPIGLITLLVLRIKIQDTRLVKSKKGIDVKGAVTVVIGLAALIFGFLSIPRAGFRSWQVYCSMITGLLFLAAFIRIEIKSDHPMIPLLLFRNARFLGSNLLTLFLYAAIGAAMLFLSLNFVQIQGYSQFQSGFTFLPLSILMILLSEYAGNLADRYGSRNFLIFGPIVAGVGLIILAFVKQTSGVGDYWRSFFPGIFVFGLGITFTVPSLTSTVMSSVGDRYMGTASGINNAISRIANVFANSIFGVLALIFFQHSIHKQLDLSSFRKEEKEKIAEQIINLGNAQAPSFFSTSQKTVITSYYHKGFVQAYRNIMIISAVCCFAGALISAVFILHRNETVV